jgi:hypothetical protein
MDHPGSGSAARDAGHVEKRDDATGATALVAVGEMAHLRVVRVHSLPHQPQSEPAAVEVDVGLDVGGDRGDVVETVDLH